ncbi:MAG: TonB-dependent receptor [Acidobacteria bacterium]|nr:TonB-dependent receptor [Acidobacteriota bacterium]MBI3663105.1 TonB-dependent receptor [Acidobacteriota bacterium]
MKKMWGVVFVLAVALAMAGSAWGQSQITTGVIQGTVLDASGAVVPGASVEVRNLDTNLTRTLTTNGDGRFVALQLPPGRYEATITNPGFAKLVQQNITVTVGQSVTLTVNMKVAAATETVTVTATPTVDTIKTEMSSTLNELTVGNTPILGRKVEDLLTLTPGVSIVQGPDGDEITFNGQRGIFSNISVDGGDFMNGFFGEQVGGQRVAVDITLEAVKEFQVVATGANAEFGRTASGVVNIITRSGTNEIHGSLFHYQRHENLSSNTSDGKPLKDFHREQFGGTIGGPIVKDKMFYFFAIERITGNLQRDNLSAQIGSTACPVATPVVPANEALINSNPDCQRLALTNFIRTTRTQEEAKPVRRPIYTTALLGKADWNLTPSNQLAISYNFNASKKVNETFDVATYGNSANGIEGNFTKIHAFNVNLFSSISATKVNEAHFTYLREVRPRAAVKSNVPADTGVGFAPSFRFGQPFFLEPQIDETFWRSQIKDNFSIVWRKHTVKFGGEWIHSLNDQVFRGFFTGRYLFDSAVGFLRYASPAAPGGFGPNTVACSDGTYVTSPTTCTGPATPTGGPLLFYLQGADRAGVATDATGASKIKNEEYGLFIQDKWQVWSNFSLSYGLRWEAQIFPKPVTPPSQTAYGSFLSNPAFPSNGTLRDQKKMFQPRLGFAWDIRKNGKSVLRANAGIFNARQNMLSQVGSITTNGVQQQTIFRNTALIGILGTPPVWPNPCSATSPTCTIAPLPPGTFGFGTGVRVFHRDYHNPRIYSANVTYEQEIYPDWAIYTDFTWSKGVFLTRFLDYSRTGLFSPLGEVMTATSFGQSLYRGWTIGMRKRLSKHYQLEWNYVVSSDYDDDSNERDPFTDRAFCPFTGNKCDYAYSDRDIRHKFNFFTYAELPWKVQVNVRMQARTAQPITPATRTATNRNSLRKDNEFFSLDWRVVRPFHITERIAITPMVEMFNTFNNKNNVNPLSTAALFDFNGFLRFGVGDPRQAQIAIKLTF